MSNSSSLEQWLSEFCQEPFWDEELSWNTATPKLSRCFRQTIFKVLPCFVLWILAPIESIWLARSKALPIPWTHLNVGRLLALLLCILVNIFEMVEVVLQSASYIDSDFYAPLIKAASMMLAGIFLYYDRQRGFIRDGPVWLFVALSFAFYIPVCVNTIMFPESFLPYHVYSTWVYAIFVGILLLLCSFADRQSSYTKATTDEQADKLSNDVDRTPNPELSASYPSRLTFWWFTSLAYLGWKQDLTMNDLWSLRPEDTTKVVGENFEKSWRQLQGKPKTDDLSVQYVNANGNTKITKAEASPKKKKPSIVSAMIKTFGTSFLAGSLCKLIHDCLAFSQPQLLKWMIQFIETPQDPFWHGLFIVFLMFTVSTLQSVILATYFHRMFLIGLHLRTALTGMIYRKALILSNSARKESTIGEIVNLMSVDAQRFTELMSYINLLWSSPLQIFLSVYFLWQELGPSVLAGVGVMVLMIPLNAVVAGYSKKIQVQTMKLKDKRVKAMNELLSGIKVIKLYAWENSFFAEILGLRNREITQLKKFAYLNSVTTFLWTCAPFLVALVTFTIYVLSDPSHVLDAQKAFVSLTLFNMLRFPLTMLPNMITLMVMASVSVKRLNKYLNSPELKKYVTNNNEENDITIEKGSFTWDSTDSENNKDKKDEKEAKDKKDKDEEKQEMNGKAEPISEEPQLNLKDIDLHVPPGSLVAIVGTVGSGKSSLLNAILGEMEIKGGRVNVSGNKSIAYVPQQAWIQNATLKENVLFGNALDARRYNHVIKNCALKADIDILPGGDLVEIGEKGINLSGGQKQRVSLARACYSDADIYLLDDPLSAVDSHVAKHLFDKVLSSRTGMLKNKTRVLVTNQVSLLPNVDNILVLKNGSVSETGNYKELISRNQDFAEFIRTFDSERENPDAPGSPGPDGVRDERAMSRSMSRSISVDQPTQQKEDDQKKLIEKEKAETGEVKRGIYIQYFKAISVFWVTMIVLGFFGNQGASAGANYWLSLWSNDKPLIITSPDGNSTELVQDVKLRNTRLIVYAILGFLQALTIGLGSFAMAKGTLDASAILHKKLLDRILRSPMMFFDTTPLGRIINRFSKDIDVVDQTIPGVMRGWLACLLQVIATIVMIGIATPLFLVVILPISVIYYFVQKFYVPTSRQLKRLESITRSPIYSHFSETLSGVSTIRAYNHAVRFIKESDHKVDYNQLCTHPAMISNRWLAIRLEFCGNCIIMFSALFAVFYRETIDPGLAGLSVSYALSVTQTLNWLIRMTSELETNIVSVERIQEYCGNETEAEWVNQEHRPKDQWPEKGEITFDQYGARYRPGLDLVIKNITTKVNPEEKIGIVGRTGAGKSTITLSLFRIIEAAEGHINIDGENISKLGLHDLRSRLTIIPQDPVLFSGTIRSNLDPFKTKSDEELYKALDHAHLKEFVNGLSQGLEHEVTEGGENLSVGQRQLICLARALLRKTKILLLDEATAAVDLETDSLIQNTIRTEFADCTILTIAHRLNTILDSTRVMVLDKGEIIEFDAPEKLLKDNTSVFYSLAKDANLVS